MACCRKNATPVFLLLLVVFIFHFDLTHPAAVINEFAGSGRPVVLPTAGAPNAHPPKDDASSSGAGDGDGDVTVADDDSGARPEKAPCVNCEHQRSMDALRKTHGENELVQIRLEVIKEQILAKLRMTSPPSVHFPRTKLPLPLLYPQGEIMQNDHPSHSDPAEHDSGRFYGEPKQLIVFGKQVHNCTDRRRSACLVFEMPHDVEVEDVASAELWLYKYRSDGLGKQVFVVSEVSRGSSRHGKAAVATTLHERRVTNQRGWVKFNMRSVVRHWMKTARRDDGVVQVTCRTCRKLRHHRQSAPIEINGENRPIIVINIGARRQRTKRSASDCRFGCCMEHFYVNFTEIGWNDWIIQPKGYVANHCTGSCTAMSRSNIQPQKSHSAVIYQLDANRREPAITACCAPSRMSSISIIYHNNDGLIVNSQLPDMVVDECKCFF